MRAMWGRRVPWEEALEVDSCPFPRWEDLKPLSAGGKERLTLTRGDAAFRRVPSKPTLVVWAFSSSVDPQVAAGHGLASCLYSSQVCSHLPAVCEPHSLHPPRPLNALLLPGTLPCACSRLCRLCHCTGLPPTHRVLVSVTSAFPGPSLWPAH